MAIVYTPGGRQTIVPQQIEKTTVGIEWRGISFPVSHVSTNLEQQLIPHEYPDRDSAYVESSGRKPLIIKATAHFNNFLSPGPNENWIQGDLFPKTYKQFFAACQDSTAGTLKHPHLGSFSVKLQSFTTDLDATGRGGVVCEVSWIETTDQTGSLTNLSANVEMQNAAVELMNALDGYATLTKDAGFPSKLGFLDIINTIAAGITLAGLVGKALVNQIDKALYYVNKLLTAVKSLNDNTLGSLRLLIEKLKFTLIQSKRVASTAPSVTVISFRTRVPSTFVDIAKTLSFPLVDLMKLNPKFAGLSIIPAGSPILYTKSV